MTRGTISGGAGKSGRRAGGKPRWWAVGVLLAIVAAPFVGLIQPAQAGVGLGVTPTFPSPVTVGDTGLPASLQILNASTPPDNVDPLTIERGVPGPAGHLAGAVLWHVVRQRLG